MIYFQIYLIVSLVVLLALFHISKLEGLQLAEFRATDWAAHLAAAFVPFIGIIVIIAEAKLFSRFWGFLVKERFQ